MLEENFLVLFICYFINDVVLLISFVLLCMRMYMLCCFICFKFFQCP